MHREARIANYILASLCIVSLTLLSLPLSMPVQAFKTAVSYILNPVAFYGAKAVLSSYVIGATVVKVLSVPDAIGIAIERWMHEKQGVQQDLLAAEAAEAPVVEALVVARPRAIDVGGQQPQLAAHDADQHIGACPDCGSQLEYAEGCVKCHVCGYSECG